MIIYYRFNWTFTEIKNHMTQARICQKSKHKSWRQSSKKNTQLCPSLLCGDESAHSEVIGASAKCQSWLVSVLVWVLASFPGSLSTLQAALMICFCQTAPALPISTQRQQQKHWGMQLLVRKLKIWNKLPFRQTYSEHGEGSYLLISFQLVNSRSSDWSLMP